VTAPPFDPRRARLVHGGVETLPERLTVYAGPLSLVLEAGDVRHVHLGSREVVRRIYGAVRDHTWQTIPSRLSAFSLDVRPDSFSCRYRAEHRLDPVAFTWDATIEGRPDGTLTFAFDGVADATFERNRIGLCLLHPTPELAGAPVRATTTDGAQRSLRFPDLVAVEQPIAGFDDLARLACEIAADVWLEAAFAGDIFETEDQRNWIDASYKTYSTPSALPKPVTVTRGTRIAQRITLRLVTASGETARVTGAPFVIDRESGTLRFGDGREGRLPTVGVRVPAIADPVRAADTLRPIAPAHLRVELDLAGDATGAGATLAHVSRVVAALDAPGGHGPTPIELALHLPADPGDAAAALATLSIADLAVARVLAFTAGHDATQPSTLAAVRVWRGGQAHDPPPPIATGTTSDLARIHLSPPVPGDAVCWAMHPQAHATDLTSIAETPAGAHDQVIAVRHRFPGLPMAIAASFGHPRHAETRTRSLFAAGWTLALLAALGRAGAERVTLVDALADADSADDLSAIAVAHVLAALAARTAASFRPIVSTLPTVHAFALDSADRSTLFVANLAPRACEVDLPGSDRTWRLRRLDAETILGQNGPGALLGGDTEPLSAGRLHLGPCAIARLDGTPV
jgi:hypothetical protein